jgi:hypothetical protein
MCVKIANISPENIVTEINLTGEYNIEGLKDEAVKALRIYSL